MLSPVALSYSRREKFIFWHVLQKLAVDGATCLHATSISEFYEFRSFGIKQPIAIIPNGIDLQDVVHLGSPSRDGSSRTLLFFGRIHSKKGLDILIPAWGRVAACYPSWRLRIIGPGEIDEVKMLDQLIVTHQAPRVSVEGPAYGNDKWRILSEADLFVLPTHNENFGIAVAESLACHRPVIVGKGAPWSGVEAHRCGWWVGSDEIALAEGLMAALSTPDEVLDEMGQRGAAWMKQDFSWDKIGVEMARVYDWILGRGGRPDCVDILDGYEMADFNER
jgi:glycosyltransferase involved in cell wall biosynthesis